MGPDRTIVVLIEQDDARGGRWLMRWRLEDGRRTPAHGHCWLDRTSSMDSTDMALVVRAVREEISSWLSA